MRRVGFGEKTFLHPEVGSMTLGHEVLDVVRTAGQRLVVYSAEPGTPDHDAMTLLDMKGAELTVASAASASAPGPAAATGSAAPSSAGAGPAASPEQAGAGPVFVF